MNFLLCLHLCLYLFLLPLVLLLWGILPTSRHQPLWPGPSVGRKPRAGAAETALGGYLGKPHVRGGWMGNAEFCITQQPFT